MTTMQAEQPQTFKAQLFGGRWDGRWYQRLSVLPGRIIVADPLEDDEDHKLYYIRADWSSGDYSLHGYMRYNLEDGGYYGSPYRRRDDGDDSILR